MAPFDCDYRGRTDGMAVMAEEEEVASAASTRQTIPDPELRRLVVGIL
jgi:hypothetical protein